MSAADTRKKKVSLSMGSDLISIIVPIYNVEKYLRKCIDSIVNQTYKNLEIILVDDGSPDNCGAICDEYAKKDERIKVIHKENGGLSDARNAGIDAATGKYIGFIDSDDYIAPDMYEKLYFAMFKAKADIAISNFLYVDEEGKASDKNNNLPIQNEILSGRQILDQKMCRPKYCYWVVAWNKLYKKSIFDDIRYPVSKIHEDEFVIHNIYAKAARVACISDALIYYVQRADSIMGREKSMKRLDFAEAFFGRAEFYLRENYDNECAYHTLCAAADLMSYLYNEYKDNASFKERYAQLLNTYRNIVRHMSFRGMSVKHRVNLMLKYISPYLVWKLKHRFSTHSIISERSIIA